MVTWSCLGFPCALVPTSTLLAWSLTTSSSSIDHVRGNVSRVSQRIDILRSVKRVFVDTSVLLRCYYSFVLQILEYCSPVWGSAAECHLQLLEPQVYSVLEKICETYSRAPVSCRCDIDVMLLLCVCWKRLIRTRIIVCSVSFHLLLSEFNIPELRLQLIHYGLKSQGVERPNLQGVSCRPRLVCGMTFPTLCLT